MDQVVENLLQLRQGLDSDAFVIMLKQLLEAYLVLSRFRAVAVNKAHSLEVHQGLVQRSELGILDQLHVSDSLQDFDYI